jgi:hypothetical protein
MSFPNDQPTVMYNYNTDQFTDPVYGYTVHDDGSQIYVQPQTGLAYTKIRTYNGQSPSGYISYDITLVQGVAAGYLITEDASQLLITEDGSQALITEQA